MTNEQIMELMALIDVYAVSPARLNDNHLYLPARAAVAAALEQLTKAASCTWTQDPDFEMGDTWDSSCGEKWSFIDGGPEHNRVRYCHGCGGGVAAP